MSLLISGFFFRLLTTAIDKDIIRETDTAVTIVIEVIPAMVTETTISMGTGTVILAIAVTVLIVMGIVASPMPAMDGDIAGITTRVTETTDIQIRAMETEAIITDVDIRGMATTATTGEVTTDF